MVVQRTIEHLKTRPKEDRRAVATTLAFAVSLVIFAAWSYYFVRTFNPTPITSGVQEVYTASANAVGTITVDGMVIPQ
jgi:fatty acid desaturase